MAWFRVSGAVPPVADLPPWPAQGQVGHKRYVVPVGILAILRLFKDNSSYIDNVWSSGRMVRGAVAWIA